MHGKTRLEGLSNVAKQMSDHESQTRGKGNLAYIEVFSLAISKEALDIAETSPHPHSYIKFGSHWEEAEDAISLVICVSGTVKDPKSPQFGKPFAYWLHRTRYTRIKSVVNHSSINSMMSLL
jgi:hypothetical protein